MCQLGAKGARRRRSWPMSGETLLDRCLAAHGGRDRWHQFGAIDVDLTTSGLVFATHGQPSLRTMARVATREPLVVLSPYRRWPRGVFQRDRVFIEDASGRVRAERKNPRAHGSWTSSPPVGYARRSISSGTRCRTVCVHRSCSRRTDSSPVGGCRHIRARDVVDTSCHVSGGRADPLRHAPVLPRRVPPDPASRLRG